MDPGIDLGNRVWIRASIWPSPAVGAMNPRIHRGVGRPHCDESGNSPPTASVKGAVTALMRFSEGDRVAQRADDRVG
jgi:hypothetical protein